VNKPIFLPGRRVFYDGMSGVVRDYLGNGVYTVELTSGRIVTAFAGSMTYHV
jgi:translation initiation factor IF-1